MGQDEHSIQRSSAASEQERQQDGSGHRTPAQGTEASRGNKEPTPEAPATDLPIQTIKGEHDKPIVVQEDNGITAAERANDA